MATPDELRAGIAKGREDLKAAIESAGDKWERKPAAGSGEDAWSPRAVAEHAIASEVAFATEVCVACGYPGLDKWEASYASPAEALEGLTAAAAKADGRLKYVTDKDLEMAQKYFGTVAGLMAYNAQHLHDHAQQIRDA